MSLVRQFLGEDRGVTSIEYALIACLIAMVIIVGSTTLGTQLNATFGTIAGLIPNG